MLSRIDHIGVAVDDLDAAKALYEQTFGMTCVHEETNEGQGVHEAMMAVGDSGSCVQLLVPLTAGVDDRASSSSATAPASTTSPTPSTTSTPRAPGCAPPATGCSTTSRAAAPSGSRINFVHPKDAGGVLVELVEHPRDRSTS